MINFGSTFIELMDYIQRTCLASIKHWSVILEISAIIWSIMNQLNARKNGKFIFLLFANYFFIAYQTLSVFELKAATCIGEVLPFS